VLGLACSAFKTYLALASHEYVAMALWAMHTHVFDRYMVTPRLLLTSPVRGCGKTVALDVLSRLVTRPDLSDSITAAALYDTIDRDRCTMLIDEADNLELSAKAALRAVLNSGYRKGRKVRRGAGKGRRAYDTFAAIALAAIGILSLPLMSRSIAIRMRRHDESHELRRFDLNNTRDLDQVYIQIREWAPTAKLSPNPKMPPELHGRDADNWRPLLAIADSFGPEWGRIARATAVVFAQDRREEDVVVVLLKDIREIFNACGLDRLTGKALLNALHELEDAGWSEFCGVKNDRTPHRLRNSELRAMLRSVGIMPRSMWPSKGRPGDHSAKGYYREDFEAAWRAYCDGSETGKPANIFSLQSRGKGT